MPEEIAALINHLNAQMNNSPKITLTEVQALAELLPKVQNALDKTLRPWCERDSHQGQDWTRSLNQWPGIKMSVRLMDDVWCISATNSVIRLPPSVPAEVCKELADLIARMWGYTLLDDSSEAPTSEGSTV